MLHNKTLDIVRGGLNHGGMQTFVPKKVQVSGAVLCIIRSIYRVPDT